MILLEGPHLLAEAMAADLKVCKVYAQAAWAGTAEGARLLEAAREKGAEPVEVTPAFLSRAAATDTPPPVLATARPPSASRQASVRRLGLVVDGLQDPGNLGTILRVAWGAGADAVYAAPGTVDFYAPKVLRAGQGAHFHLDLRETGRDELLAAVRREGWHLVATEAAAAVPLWRARLERPCLVCIGNEARGIGADFLAAAEERVAVPLAPGVDSLNAAVTAGIVLFELVRRGGGF